MPPRENSRPGHVFAPYNFIPLSRFVWFPIWGDQVSHDHPFERGICGRIRIRIVAETPLLVGGKREKISDGKEKGATTITFFETPEGPAIPGSTLKGLIRNVVEIMSFSRLSAVDAERRMAVRDLTASARSFYGDRITERMQDGTIRSRVHTGFLNFVDREGWQIIPCRYGRIDHGELIKSAGGAPLLTDFKVPFLGRPKRQHACLACVCSCRPNRSLRATITAQTEFDISNSPEARG